MGLFGLAGFSVGLGIANSLRSMKMSADMLAFDIATTMFAGVQAKMSVADTWMMFAMNQGMGFGIGFALGKAIKIGGALWDGGLSIAPPRSAASVVNRVRALVRRPFAIVHNSNFRFGKSSMALAKAKKPVALKPINAERLGQFDPVQRQRLEDWIRWARNTDGIPQTGVKGMRLHQEQVNAGGLHVSRGKPDLQFTLPGGRKYTLPNGAEIDLTHSGDRRVYIEFDPVNGGRSTRHLKHRLGDDPDGIVILDTFDEDGLVSTMTHVSS